MKSTIRKSLLTLQSEVAFLTGVKEAFYRFSRRLLRIPHENDFRLLKLVRSDADDCYIDVGANKGQSIESILLFKPDARIVSFEPNVGLAQKLEMRYGGRENIRIVPKGLADSAGRFTLFVPQYKHILCYDLASLDKQAAATWITSDRVFGFDPSRLSVFEFACEVSTLDSQQLNPVFIKVDVQGYEYHVLNGARETIKKHEPILLVEDFKGDPRTARLAEELGYEEYQFDGTSLRKGPSNQENSFLLTPRRMKDLVTSAAR